MQREWLNQYFCTFCRRNLETVKHIFTECPHSHRVWEEIADWASLPGFKPQDWLAEASMIEWFTNLSGQNTRSRWKGASSLSILICWALWRERNSMVFEGEEKSIARLITEIKDEASLWVRAGAKHLLPIVSAHNRE
jgi:hypothetical protein